MRKTIQTVEDLGLILRAVRKSSGVRQDDLAQTVGVSKQFTANVERGKSTVQMGLVLKLLKELGITLNVDFPDAVAPVLRKLQTQRSLKSEPLAEQPIIAGHDKRPLLFSEGKKTDSN